MIGESTFQYFSNVTRDLSRARTFASPNWNRPTAANVRQMCYLLTYGQKMKLKAATSLEIL